MLDEQLTLRRLGYKVCLAFLSFAVLAGCNDSAPTNDTGTSGFVVASRVLDGSTIELEDGQLVNYLGVTTVPLAESSVGKDCFGLEAVLRNKELVEGRTIRLEKDARDKDPSGRLLRYVFVDDKMVNETLV